MSYFSKFFWLLILPFIIKVSYTNSKNLELDHDNNYTFYLKAGYKQRKQNLAKYIVSLRKTKSKKYFGDNHGCGGMILSPTSILTAAHCVTYKSGKKYGNDRKIEIITGSPFLVGRILVHPNYVNVSKGHDIAILYLKKRLELDYNTRWFIPLIDKEQRPNIVCTGFGWGEIFYNGPTPDELTFESLTIVKALRYCNFRKFLVCATTYANHESKLGRGDSGGPLICNGSLVGASSHGQFLTKLHYDIKNKRLISMYTSVYYYRKWINENVYNKNPGK